MATSVYEIPLLAAQQAFTVAIGGASYRMALAWCDAAEGGWLLDIGLDAETPIVSGIPLVTGADLLEQYVYLGLGFGLWAATNGDPDAVPTFENLGSDARLFITVTS